MISPLLPSTFWDFRCGTPCTVSSVGCWESTLGLCEFFVTVYKLRCIPRSLIIHQHLFQSPIYSPWLKNSYFHNSWTSYETFSLIQTLGWSFPQRSRFNAIFLIFQFLILPMGEDVSLFFCLIYRKIFRIEHSPSLILTLRFLPPQFHFLPPLPVIFKSSY